MQVWRRGVVPPLQRVEQALRVDLELLSGSAGRRRFFQLDQIAVDAARPAGVGRVVE
jgi:hypothetical protein